VAVVRVSATVMSLNKAGLRFSIGIVALMASACSPEEPSEPTSKFLDDFLLAASDAAEIQLVEHSYPSDFQDRRASDLEEPPHFEYLRLALSPDQKKGFIEAFQRMSSTPKNQFSLCAFEPHHSIEFHRRDGTSTTVLVCFKCNDTEWEGSEAIPPKDFQNEFARFITPLGFQPTRDWIALAKQRVQEGAEANSAPRSSRAHLDRKTKD
jgi:hypothetical protein